VKKVLDLLGKGAQTKRAVMFKDFIERMKQCFSYLVGKGCE
jgi:hypothetical protein